MEVTLRKLVSSAPFISKAGKHIEFRHGVPFEVLSERRCEETGKVIGRMMRQYFGVFENTADGGLTLSSTPHFGKSYTMFMPTTGDLPLIIDEIVINLPPLPKEFTQTQSQQVTGSANAA